MACSARGARRHARPPSLLATGGGYDRNITSIEALRAMIEYIHANPVRRGFVANMVDWEWSSVRWYASIRPVKIEMDTQVLMELARG